MSVPVKLKDFYQRLNTFDWTYEMSDDHGVWQRGRAAQGELEAIAKQSPEHKALWDAFTAYCWHNSGIKPTEPKE